MVDERQTWMNRAALFELLALSFLRVGNVLSDALVSGEYAEALDEVLGVNNLFVDRSTRGALADYVGRDSEDVLCEIRRDRTRLFVGVRDPLVSPYAGVWWAKDHGVPPMLFVGRESMAIERFMRSCGVGRADGPNEPLDHIGSLLEFLQFLCLVRAEAVAVPEGFEIPDTAYGDFRREHFDDFAERFARAVAEQTSEGVYRVAAYVLHASVMQWDGSHVKDSDDGFALLR